ncbi:SDH family Clp fold serine proteinase [Alicyclobacillus macrosporangiidus]|uniref:SDH family Clp fold serine proteinase n=1 Tax=Alicyclobacillus macrosporangiidus TaxID=392015 RepID=UPI000494EDF1|nr:ATP-dependent Clp protease proteolytic subunit [Alicyclobacillus macrosporangiidus]
MWFWILFFLWTLLPVWRQQWLHMQRLRAIRQLEKRRGTRVITLIHRQETISFLGLPLRNYISIDDSEQVLRAIRLTPDHMPIDLILHTPGGLVLASEQIARALDRHPAKVTVFVPHYAMSGGTMIALAADEIVMDDNAVLGPVDPQLGQYPAASLLEVVANKPIAEIRDETLILVDMARKAQMQVERFVVERLRDKMPLERAEELAKILSSGRWTHDYPITVEQLVEFGLPVRVGLPVEVYELMDLYPQPAQRRPTVQYIPTPYDGPARGGRPR